MQRILFIFTACDPYTFGKGCKEHCYNCRHNKPCNVVTGACINECDPGWVGEKCDIGKLWYLDYSKLGSIIQIICKRM